MGWLIDMIPMWVYVVGIVLVVLALLYFFHPILIPLWNVTPRWVKVALGFVVAIFLAFVRGRNTGAKNARDAQKKRDERAVQKRQEIHDDVQKLSPKDTDKRLDKWYRD